MVAYLETNSGTAIEAVTSVNAARTAYAPMLAPLALRLRQSRYTKLRYRIE